MIDRKLFDLTNTSVNRKTWRVALLEEAKVQPAVSSTHHEMAQQLNECNEGSRL